MVFVFLTDLCLHSATNKLHDVCPFFVLLCLIGTTRENVLFFVRCLLFLEIGLKFVIREGRVSVRGMKP